MTVHINSFNFAEETIYGDVAVCNDYRWWDEVAVDYKPYEPYGAFCIEVNGQRVILSNMDKPTLQRSLETYLYTVARGFTLTDLLVEPGELDVRVSAIDAAGYLTSTYLSRTQYSEFLKLLTTPTHP